MRVLKTLSRLDMRALNSGRRWGSDVPTFKDIAHAVGVLYERFQNRSAELRTIVDRVEGVKDKFSKVLLNTAETKPCVKVARAESSIFLTPSYFRLKTFPIQFSEKQPFCLQLLRAVIPWSQKESNRHTNWSAVRYTPKTKRINGQAFCMSEQKAN